MKGRVPFKVMNVLTGFSVTLCVFLSGCVSMPMVSGIGSPVVGASTDDGAGVVKISAPNHDGIRYSLSLGTKKARLQCEECSDLSLINVNKESVLKKFSEMHKIPESEMVDVSICAYQEGFYESCKSLSTLPTNRITAFSLARIASPEKEKIIHKYYYTNTQIVNVAPGGSVHDIQQNN